MAAKLQQAGLFPMKLKRELLKPHSHRVPEALPIGFMLEVASDNYPDGRIDSSELLPELTCCLT